MGRKKQKAKAQKISKPIDLYFFLATTIVLIPLITSTQTMDSNLAPRLLAVGIVILGFTLFNIFKPAAQKPKFEYLSLLIFPVFGLYFLWSIVSLIPAINPAEGTYDIVKTFLSLALLIYAVQIFIEYKSAFSLLVKGVIISAVIATSIGLFQYFDKVPGNAGYQLYLSLYEIKGLMAHKNQFAISLFLMLPFTLFGVFNMKKWWWWLSLYSTLLILINIVILQTRSVWVATVVFVISLGILWFAFFKKNKFKSYAGLYKKALAVAGILVVVMAGSYFIFQKSGTVQMVNYQVSSLFDTKSDNNQGRLKMWESTWNLSKENLFMGVGTGNWRIAIVPYYQTNYGADYQNWRRPHNDFLWVLSEKGIPGLLLYLLIFIMLATYGFKILLKEEEKDNRLIGLFLISGIVGYLVIALFTFPLERINHQIYLMIMMAVLISIYYKKQKQTVSKKSRLFLWISLLTLVFSIFSVYYAGTLFKSEKNVKKILEASNRNNQQKVIKYADEAFSIFTTVSYNAMPIPIYKGLAYMSLQKNKQAYQEFQTALKYFPTHIAVLSNLAIVSSSMNDNKKALSYLRQSLDLYPTYETSLYNMTNVYYRQKEYEKAYVALLSCNSKKVSKDYDRFMRVLMQRVNNSKK